MKRETRDERRSRISAKFAEMNRIKREMRCAIGLMAVELQAEIMAMPALFA